MAIASTPWSTISQTLTESARAKGGEEEQQPFHTVLALCIAGGNR
jgi:hypothetical protein